MQENKNLNEERVVPKKLPEGILIFFILFQAFVVFILLLNIAILAAPYLGGWGFFILAIAAYSGAELGYGSVLFLIVLTTFFIIGDYTIIQNNRGRAKLPLWVGVLLAGSPLFILILTVFFSVFSVFRLFF